MPGFRTALCAMGSISVVFLAWEASSEETVSGYVGNEACEACHEETIATFSHTIHAKVLNEKNARTEAMRFGCESCHGPGAAHVDAGGGRGQGGPGWVSFSETEDPEARNAVCLGCHRGGERLHWSGSPHQSRGFACTNCHDVMRKVSPDNQLKKANVVDTCAQCHTIRRSQTFRNSHMPTRVGALEEG